MSLLGKILAFLNIFGAAALIYCGTLAYAKRQSGAYAVFVCDLVLNGLPLDEGQRTPQGRPVHELIDDKLKKDLFEQTGNGVATQSAEVEAVRNKYRGGADALADKREQMAYQARVLLPLTDDSLEREWLHSTRTHLASARSFALLRALYDESFRQALSEVDRDVVSMRPEFEVAFRQALRGAVLQDLQDVQDHRELRELRGRRGPRDPMLHDRAIAGALAALAKSDPTLKSEEAKAEATKKFREQVCQPSNPFDLNFLKAIPDAEVVKLAKSLEAVREAGDDAVRTKAARDEFEKGYRPLFDQAFAKAYEAQQKWLADRFAQPFDAAEPVGPSKVYTVGQRRAIARLLVRLAILRAEDELNEGGGDAKDKALLAEARAKDAGRKQPPTEYLDAIAKTTVYAKHLRRAQVVVGLRSAVDAVGERARALQQIYPEVVRHAIEDRAEFVGDHQQLLEEIKQRSDQLDVDVALLAREKELLRLHNVVVAKRTIDVDEYEMELAGNQAETAKSFALLQKRAEDLYEWRIRLRDVDKNNRASLEKILKRERRIRELEKDDFRGAP